jgi:hypothetical protein
VVSDDASPAGATGPNLYVYADFVNLNNYVSDDGPLSSITWSYAVVGSARYRFNGARALDLGTESPATPPSAAQINSATNISGTGEFNPDNNVLTPTVRDQILSPFGGPNVNPGGAAGTVVGSQTVTLFASDGTTAGQRSLVVYSVKGVLDHLSATPTPLRVNEATLNFATGTNGWIQGQVVGSTTLAAGTGGLCTSVTALGGNIGEWVSPYAFFPLVTNSVWRVRATMSTTQTTAGLVPLWDVILSNLDNAGVHGDNAYIGDYNFLDNTGSANAIKGPTPGLNQFDIWYTPAAVSTPQWKSTTTGAFTVANDPNNDMRIVFRVLDSDSGGYGGELDAGQICMTNLVVDRYDLNSMITGQQVYNIGTSTPIVQGINGVSVQDVVGSSTSGGGSIVDFTTAPLTISPADALGWLTELTLITPGDITNPPLNDPSYGNGSSIVDNYPIIWEGNTLYELLVEASAPTVADESNAPDCIRLGFDTKTIELFGSSYQLTGLGYVGMPKAVATVGGTQMYTMFWWSHNATLATTPEAGRMRWKVDVLNTTAYNRPTAADTRDTGKVRFHSFSVYKVTFFDQ